MRTVRSLTIGLALAATLPSVASAQPGRLFKNSWFWGAKAGITSFSTDRVQNAVAPHFGVEWLITRTRGALYIAADQALFNEQSTIVTNQGAEYRVDVHDLRKVTIAGLAFPVNLGTLRPYAGVGIAINFVQQVTPTTVFDTPDDETDVRGQIIDRKDRAAFITMVGIQAQYQRFSAFGQASIMPAQARFLLNSRPVYHLEGGIRWNVGSAIERPN